MYFQRELPALIPPLQVPIKRKKYKMAYFILVQDIGAVEQLQVLLDVLKDGVILLQVDATPQNAPVLPAVNAMLSERQKQNVERDQNVYIASTSYKHIFGHISVLFSHLNGFFELLDLVDWDYVINLSSYDWPLRKTEELHRILEKRPRNSWMEFWMDSQTLASRMFRPYIGSRDYSTVAHSMSFGLRSWPFPTWRTFRQSPWMILSREAVSHFRSDRTTLNFLAFLEHSFAPDESFYATALMNSPLSNRLQGDKRRYNREPGSGATTWVGWADRHIFPPGQTEPRYLFFRPFNALGTTYDESKLVRWVGRNHLEMLSGSECIVGQMGTREECLRAFAEKVAIDNHVVLVPVNKAFLSLASNLRCSLARVGWTNVIHWALDSETHGKTSKYVCM